MEYALYLRKLLDDRHCVLVSIPLMDDHRQVKLPCQRQLGDERLFLKLSGDILIMIVQADLANGFDLRIQFT